jgi:hypothetical protein
MSVRHSGPSVESSMRRPISARPGFFTASGSADLTRVSINEGPQFPATNGLSWPGAERALVRAERDTSRFPMALATNNTEKTLPTMTCVTPAVSSQLLFYVKGGVQRGAR